MSHENYIDRFLKKFRAMHKNFFIKTKIALHLKIFHTLHSKKLFLLQLRQKIQRLYINEKLNHRGISRKSKDYQKFLRQKLQRHRLKRPHQRPAKNELWHQDRGG